MSNHNQNPEQVARDNIDEMLISAGWKVQQKTQIDLNDIDENLFRTEALRQSILKRAFSGQLVPQDPSDELASILLERIAAGKAAVSTKAKKTKKPKKRIITRKAG
ncbi:MAG: hypothetical protein V3U75_02710 [Methylococcaceae bacterium]